MPRNQKSQQTFTVQATLTTRDGAETPPARIYLFDRDGALVDSKPVGDKAVTFSAVNEFRHRLVVGPDLPVEGRSPTDLAAELTKAGAISQDFDPRLGSDQIKLEVPPSIHICWWKTCIYVHGSVRKQTSPGVYATICDGVVQIFQLHLGCTLDQLA